MSAPAHTPAEEPGPGDTLARPSGRVETWLRPRFTRGATGAGLVLGLSLVVWLVAPTFLAIRRLRRADV